MVETKAVPNQKKKKNKKKETQCTHFCARSMASPLIVGSRGGVVDAETAFPITGDWDCELGLECE